MDEGVKFSLLFLICVSSCFGGETLQHRAKCEASCTASRPKGISEADHDAPCHRGCRLFRIVYMLSHPFMELHQVGRQCDVSCGDGYPNKKHQLACANGCSLQVRRLASFQNTMTSLESGTQPNFHSPLQPFRPSGPAPELTVKRLHMWTLIRSNHYPRLVIIRTERTLPNTGVQVSGQLVMAPPRSGHQLELGGVRDTTALNAAGPLSKKQRDFWWVCVLDRTLQPLMAGLLLLSFLILLWLCLSYAKEMASGRSNSEIAVKPKEMPKLDLVMLDPHSALPPGSPEKVALFKVPMEKV